MRLSRFIISCLLLTSAFGQQPEAAQQTGVIHGVAFLSDGQPAQRIRLEAFPSGGNFVIAGILPFTKTNDQGGYRFENLQFGSYMIVADDENAGYSASSRPTHADRSPIDVEISFEHPIAELTVNLPPKAGFLRIHLTNKATGADLKEMEVVVMSSDKPESPVFTESCIVDHLVLVPPDEHLLLHVSSKGFREWSESIGAGKEIYVLSGDQLKLDVTLEPL